MKTSRMLAAVLAASIAGATVLSAQDPTPPAGGRGGGRGGPPGPPSMGGGNCSANPYNCPDAVNPLPAPNTVWMEDMTWMDIRDALKAGKTTAIIATGGMEPNGPWLASGKHNFVLHANCEAIARKMGNALCAPIVKFVPEGSFDAPLTVHMGSPGTISMREDTFRSILYDIVSSLKVHGFTQIFLIGDSGGNQPGQRAIADSLNRKWGGTPLVAHIQEYYDYAGVSKHLEEKGLKVGKSDGLHDDPEITFNMLIDDPNSVRLEQRIKAGKATINGVSLTDKKKNLEWAKEVVAFRTETTISAINKAIANKGTLPPAPRGRD
ncbi:MAG: creatininase family protein [Gemmatimonadaceae bacterium]